MKKPDAMIDSEPTTGAITRRGVRDGKLVLRHPTLQIMLVVVVSLLALILASSVIGSREDLRAYKSPVVSGADAAAWRAMVREVNPEATRSERERWALESAAFAESRAEKSTGAARAAWEEAGRLAKEYEESARVSSRLAAHADTLAALSAGIPVDPVSGVTETGVGVSIVGENVIGETPSSVFTDRDQTGNGATNRG